MKLLQMVAAILCITVMFSTNALVQGQGTGGSPQFVGDDGNHDPATPRITSILPTLGVASYVVRVTLTGTGFGVQPTLHIDSGIDKGISVAGYISRTNLTIVADLLILAGAIPGNHIIQVCGPGNVSNMVNFFVQVPTSLRVLSQGVSTTRFPNPLPNGCPSDRPFGMQLRVRYQVLDQQGQLIKIALPIRENMLNFLVDGQRAGDDLLNAMPTPSGQIEPDGTFIDDGVGGCATGPFTVATFTQELFTRLSATMTPMLRTNRWVLLGRRGCGRMTNGVDLDVNVPCP